MKALLILIAIALASCAEFEGNGVFGQFKYVDPDTGAEISIRTAK